MSGDTYGRNNGWAWTFTRSITASQTPAERWAALVLRACEAERDPSTVRTWGAAVGSCETTIHATCRFLDLTARDSRDFARMLRALRIGGGSLAALESHLPTGREFELGHIPE